MRSLDNLFGLNSITQSIKVIKLYKPFVIAKDIGSMTFIIGLKLNTIIYLYWNLIFYCHFFFAQ